MRTNGVTAGCNHNGVVLSNHVTWLFTVSFHILFDDPTPAMNLLFFADDLSQLI